MTLDELLRLLGITQKDAEAIRLVDGVVPSVDFVDLGANGLGENGFLVKKGRSKMFGSLQKDENGNWAFVTKGTDTEPVKISAANKTAITELIAAQKGHIEALEAAVAGAEEDDSAEDMPETVKTLLGALSKAVTVEEPETEPEPAPAAKPATKAADVEPETEPEPETDDGTFSIGDMVLTGNLANIAKSMAEAAGDQMQDEGFAKQFAEIVGPMAQLQAQLDPNTATNQAVAGVSKRMKSEMAELRALVTQQQETINALAAGGVMGGLIVPDGSPQPEPTKKSKGAEHKPLPYGRDLSAYCGKNKPATFVTE